MCNKTQSLYKKAKRIIPGGTQLLSKRPEMFLPGKWPAYYSKAKGCKVWDLDGREYTDTSLMGVGANILGYADEDVDDAVRNAISCGSMCTLNAPEEVELAELLLELHSWAEQVRYAKTGGESLAIAIRIARAATQKDVVLFCGYHGWNDWYIAANLGDNKALDGQHIAGLSTRGIPQGLKNTVIPFRYNDLQSFEKLLQTYKEKIAAVIMEPIRNFYPEPGFLEKIREYTKKENIIFIIDEVSSGFRLNCGGAHMKFGIEPDMAVFAKAVSNGYPMAAIIGKKEVMEFAQESFISSTYWTERTGLAAAIATIEKYRINHVEKHLDKVGKKVQEGWTKLAAKNNLDIKISGMYPMSHFEFIYENSLTLKTLFTQEMLKRGFLATNGFYASFAHGDTDIERYLNMVDECFAVITEGIQQENINQLLESEVCQSGFQRLT